jgi:hypothetical protein
MPHDLHGQLLWGSVRGSWHIRPLCMTYGGSMLGQRGASRAYTSRQGALDEGMSVDLDTYALDIWHMVGLCLDRGGVSMVDMPKEGGVEWRSVHGPWCMRPWPCVIWAYTQTRVIRQGAYKPKSILDALPPWMDVMHAPLTYGGWHTEGGPLTYDIWWVRGGASRLYTSRQGSIEWGQVIAPHLFSKKCSLRRW